MTVMTTGDLYVKAMSATSTHLDAVRAEQWQNATPCTEWNVRDIANHIIGENQTLAYNATKWWL
jgi:Mycothiol maleylpyruvate isomerase N-terminal domain